MENRVKISVIVPVYNTAAYLPHCLDSLLAQTYTDLEIICVDDGSTDESGELLDKYALEHQNIRVLHTRNGGVMGARKRGLEIARGEYIGFVDSDDWVEPDMYEVLCKKMDTYRVDLVSAGYQVKGKGEEIYFDDFEEGNYDKERMTYLRENAFFHEKNEKIGIRPVMVSKLYRKILLEKMFYDIPDNLPYGEDRATTIRYLLEAESVYILNRVVYYYYMRDTSATHTQNPNYVSDMNKVYLYFRTLYSHPLFTARMRRHVEIYFVRMMFEGISLYMDFSVSYLLWHDPDWKWKLPRGSRVALYGAGLVGKLCYQNIVSDREHWLHFAGWVDKNYSNILDAPAKIESPASLTRMEYDYVVIAIKEEKIADAIKKYLTEELRVSPEKIVWNPHRPLYWKYAEAAGLLDI